MSLPAGDPATVPGCQELESNAKRDIRWCLWKWTVKIPSRTLPKLVITQPPSSSLALSIALRGEGYVAVLCAYSVPLRLGSIPISPHCLLLLGLFSRFTFGFWIWSWFNGVVSALRSKCVFLDLSCAIC